MKLWLTTKEVGNLEGISSRAVRKKLSQYAKTREVPGSKGGGKGGKRTEIHLSSLPEALQVQWVKEHTPLHPPQGGTGEVNLLEYPKWAVTMFQERKALLEGMDIVVAETRRAGGKVREAKIAYAKAQGVSRSKLYRLEKQRNEGGVAGLLPKIPARRPDKEALTDGMKSAIWNLVCTQQRRSTMQVLRRLQEYCQAHKEACPSYSTVYRFVHRKLPQATRDYYRKGVTAWRNLHEPIVHRDYSTLDVNELWCGDHRQLDVFVKTFQGTGVNAHWTVRAPWITMFLDLKSWCIVGWHLSYQPNSYTIALALRHAILRVGIPRGIYVDNGKDYRSMFLKGLTIKTKSIGTVGNNDDIQAYLDVASIQRNTPGILELLGIEARHSQPVSKDRPASGGMPRSKPIETAFNWFPEHLERECPGWRGNAPGKISERARKEIKNRDLLTLEQLEELVAATIEEHNQQPHGWRDKPAVTFYEGASVIKVHDPRTLDILLRPTKAVKVRNSEVKLNGIPYQHEELYKWSGQKVVLRYDPLDLSNLVIMSPGRPAEFICVATNAPLMSWASTSEQYKEYVVSRRKEARKVVKQKKEAEVTMAMEQQELFLQGLEENRAVAVGGAPALPGGKKYVLRQENFSSTRGTKPTPDPSQEGKTGGAPAISGGDTSLHPPQGGKGPVTKVKKIFPEFREAAEAVEAEKRHHQQAQQAAAEREASGEEPEDLLLKYYGPDSRIAQLNKREFEERDAGYYQPYDDDDDFPPEDEPEKPEWLKLFEEAQAKEAQAKGKEG